MSTNNICFFTEKSGKLSLNYHQVPTLSVLLDEMCNSRGKVHTRKVYKKKTITSYFTVTSDLFCYFLLGTVH